MTRALALLVFVAGLAAARTSSAETRFAIVIGSNQGGEEEALLRFAERDAQRMADLLMRLGGVRPENLLLMLSPTPEGVRDALRSFEQRLKRSASEPQSASLVLYYSGHADRNALHLGGSELGFGELKAIVKTIGVELAVFVVDACRSGGLLTAKGAKKSAPFTFDVRDELRAEGFAIVTSSAEDEDALESERLEGGIFTHHLLTGLIGAADESDDGDVTLIEAYRYAYAQTVATTSGNDVVQHPSYAFDVRGQDDITLTRYADVTGHGRLVLVDGGRYLVVERFGGRAIAAELDARDHTILSLAPGRYLVRRRDQSAAFETEVDVAANGTTEVRDDVLERIPFRHAVRKGYGMRERRALSLGADFEVGGELLDDTGTSFFGALALQLDFADVAVRVRLRYGRSSNDNDYVRVTQHLVGTDVSIYHLFDIGRHGLGFGLRAGADWLAQRFETERVAPPVDQLVGRVGPYLRGELALGGAVTLQLDLGAEICVLETADGDTSSVSARVVPSAVLGFGVLLP